MSVRPRTLRHSPTTRPMSDLKTQPTDASVADFLDSVEPARRRAEATRLVALMGEVSGEPPVMWGDKIVGFGQYHYRYASGHEGDWMRIGFSPQKRHLSLHLMGGTADAHAEILSRLGPHRAGVGCIYISRLDAVDEDVLRELLEASLARLAKAHPA